MDEIKDVVETPKEIHKKRFPVLHIIMIVFSLITLFVLLYIYLRMGEVKALYKEQIAVCKNSTGLDLGLNQSNFNYTVEGIPIIPNNPNNWTGR